MKYKPKVTTQSMTLQYDGVQEKPRNPLYSDISKRPKSNTSLKRKTSERNTQANKPTTVEQLKVLNKDENHHQDQLHSQTKIKKNH